MAAPIEAHPPGGRPGAAGRRILVVTPEAPTSSWGFGIRVHQLLRGLADRHRVTLLTYGEPDDGHDWDGMAALCDAVHRVRPPAAQTSKRRAQLASLMSRRSSQVSSLCSPAMQEELSRLVAGGDFDIVQVESSSLCGLQVPPGPVVVLDEHNIEYELLRRVARLERWSARKLFWHLEHLKVRREERAAWRRVDGCLTTSAVDARTIEQHAPEAAVDVTPNAVDLEYFRPQRSGEDPDELVFVGTMNYRPNSDAVTHFVKDVLPLIHRARPSAHFTAVGQGVPESLTRLASRAVTFTGTVDDVRPHVARATVVVVPLRMGSGTRLKVLEGLAMGKAMVTTSLGCEGIEVQDDEHLIIADQDEAFAAQVVRLMADAACRRRLERAGRRLVEQRYGWPAAVDHMDAFHSRLLAARAHGSRP